MYYRLRLDTGVTKIHILGCDVFCGLHNAGNSRGCRGGLYCRLPATDRGSRLAGVSLESRSINRPPSAWAGEHREILLAIVTLYLNEISKMLTG